MIVRHVSIQRITPEDGRQYWVGYYDKQPWNLLQDRLLIHRTERVDGFPAADERCEIGTMRGGAFEPAATTSAWNWQQGAHLRWHHCGGDESLLFNDLDADGQPISRWVTPEGRERRRITSALYCVTPDASIGLTLSFGRLTRLRPEYGYPAVDDTHPDIPAPTDDGVWRVDLDSGEKTLLCSIASLAALNSPQLDLTSRSAPHQHVNHIMVNPCGERCCFLHRYEREDGILQSRLFTVGIDGSGLRLLMEGMVSHYDWLDDSRVIAWGGKRRLLGSGTNTVGMQPRLMNLARRTLKPMYYALGKPRILMNRIVGDSYLVITDSVPAETQVFAKGELTCDGHNTFLRRDGFPPRWMLTDGYPDMQSRQPLYLWDIDANRGYEIGRFDTPRRLDGISRVDLHPRFSRDGSTVCFDSAMSGTRAVYAAEVRGLVSAQESVS